ncbi:MAG TPA: RcpC/CpaB family pilus assembly protein [Acidimicrobiales bacterium]|nr:RcpC/CpaB family pilus assembly protein [Acidimicrobiales bacterium]
MKKQTLMLVLIGVILFIAGSAIAYASVQGAKKNVSSTSTGSPVSYSAVVAKSNIPAGTTGQTMEAQGLVALELIPSKSYSPTDLTSLQGLTDEVLNAPVQKGQAVTATELTISTQAISIPQGLVAMTVDISGAQDLAGYLQPGSHVDIYANITKMSAGGAAGASAAIPIPCTELAMTNIEVMDVSSTSPSLAGTKAPVGSTSSSGRTVPGSETMLLALTPAQTRTLQFLSQDEAISVVQPDQEVNPPPVGQCIGTDQTVTAP